MCDHCDGCHVPDYGACGTFVKGMTGSCVYCDHAEGCHPGKGPYANGPLGGMVLTGRPLNPAEATCLKAAWDEESCRPAWTMPWWTRVDMQLHALKFRCRDWLYHHVAPHLPRIPTRLPDPPYRFCPMCGEPMEIIALDTGDGWAFGWDCENACEAFDGDLTWFPFVFGWASVQDLARVGIRVV